MIFCRIMLSAANPAVVTSAAHATLDTPPVLSRPNRPNSLQVPLSLTPAQVITWSYFLIRLNYFMFLLRERIIDFETSFCWTILNSLLTYIFAKDIFSSLLRAVYFSFDQFT